MFYSNTIFSTVGFSATAATALVGFVNMTATGFSSILLNSKLLKFNVCRVWKKNTFVDR